MITSKTSRRNNYSLRETCNATFEIVDFNRAINDFKDEINHFKDVIKHFKGEINHFTTENNSFNNEISDFNLEIDHSEDEKIDFKAVINESGCEIS